MDIFTGVEVEHEYEEGEYTIYFRYLSFDDADYYDVMIAKYYDVMIAKNISEECCVYRCLARYSKENELLVEDTQCYRSGNRTVTGSMDAIWNRYQI
jgi:hypothetical protein